MVVVGIELVAVVRWVEGAALAGWSVEFVVEYYAVPLEDDMDRYCHSPPEMVPDLVSNLNSEVSGFEHSVVVERSAGAQRSAVNYWEGKIQRI